MLNETKSQQMESTHQKDIHIGSQASHHQAKTNVERFSKSAIDNYPKELTNPIIESQAAKVKSAHSSSGNSADDSLSQISLVADQENIKNASFNDVEDERPVDDLMCTDETKKEEEVFSPITEQYDNIPLVTKFESQEIQREALLSHISRENMNRNSKMSAGGYRNLPHVNTSMKNDTVYGTSKVDTRDLKEVISPVSHGTPRSQRMEFMDKALFDDSKMKDSDKKEDFKRLVLKNMDDIKLHLAEQLRKYDQEGEFGQDIDEAIQSVVENIVVETEEQSLRESDQLLAKSPTTRFSMATKRTSLLPPRTGRLTRSPGGIDTPARQEKQQQKPKPAAPLESFRLMDTRKKDTKLFEKKRVSELDKTLSSIRKNDKKDLKVNEPKTFEKKRASEFERTKRLLPGDLDRARLERQKVMLGLNMQIMDKIAEVSIPKMK